MLLKCQRPRGRTLTRVPGKFKISEKHMVSVRKCVCEKRFAKAMKPQIVAISHYALAHYVFCRDEARQRVLSTMEGPRMPSLA